MTCSSEGVELRLEPFELFELDVQLVSYLNQEGFNPREAPRDGLYDDGHDWLNSPTPTRGFSWHL